MVRSTGLALGLGLGLGLGLHGARATAGVRTEGLGLELGLVQIDNSGANMGKFRASSLGLLELWKLAVYQPMLVGLLDRHTQGIAKTSDLQHGSLWSWASGA